MWIKYNRNNPNYTTPSPQKRWGSFFVLDSTPQLHYNRKMNVKWIIENFTNEQSYDEVISSVKTLGYEYQVIKGDYKHSDLEKYKNGSHCVIFLGSIEMTKIVQKELPNCFPVAYCHHPNYLCSKYYSYFGKYLFNDRYALISLGELYRQMFFFYGIFGKEALMFIRPDSGDKLFQAQLLDLLDLERFVKTNKHLEHELVLVSSPKNIKWEGRFIVSKYKEIIGYSTYRFQDQITKIPSVPPESMELVKELLEIGYYPDTVFCMDICQDSDNKFWLMELNSFSSAGLYASNKEVVVKRVSEIAEQDYLRTLS